MSLVKIIYTQKNISFPYLSQKTLKKPLLKRHNKSFENGPSLCVTPFAWQ